MYPLAYQDLSVDPLFSLSVYLPPVVIMVSWLLIQWRLKLVVLALVFAAVSAFCILTRMRQADIEAEVLQAHLEKHRSPAVSLPMQTDQKIAVLFASAFPFVAIGVFYVRRKRPNKSPEPTPTAVTPRANE